MNQELPLVIEKENLDTHKQDELAHWHNSFELIEVVEGKFYCNVDRSEFLINKGNICIINRGRLHHIYTEDYNASMCRKKTIIFNPDYFIKDQNI